MSIRALRVLAWSLLLVTLGFLAVTMTFIFSSAELSERIGAVFFFVPFVPGLGLVGAVIVSRHPRHPIGWIASFAAVNWALAAAIGEYTESAVAVGRTADLVRLAAWFGNVGSLFTIGLTGCFLLLLFPNGRLPSRRWRPLGWLSAFAMVTGAVGAGLAPGPLFGYADVTNPFGIGGLLGQVMTFLRLGGLVLLLLCFPASLGSLFVRYRRAEITERQQLKWLALAAALVGAALGWALVAGEVGASEPVMLLPLVSASRLSQRPSASPSSGTASMRSIGSSPARSRMGW